MSGTSPDSVSYPSQPYGLLGPYPWQTINVQDYLATGDGVTDDGPRFQLALDALDAAGGGVLIIPPAPSGVYLIGQCLRHPSNVVIRGSGEVATLKASSSFVSSSDYGGTAIFLNLHSEGSETSFAGYRDFQISFEDVWFDNIDHPASGAAHAIFHRAAQCVKIRNCHFLNGGDATAAVTCDDHLVQGCTAVGQLNCTYDHWGGSTNCRVIGCYGSIHPDSVSQVVNFNAIRTSLGTGPSEVWVTDGCLLADCDLYSNATQRSISLEPLGTGNATVQNVRIVGNRFYNVRIVMSSTTNSVVIANNQFLDCDGSSSPIWARTQNSLDANNITVTGNQFIDCNGPSGGGLIDTTAPNTTIIGNTATGGVYDYAVRFRNSVVGTYLGNNFPDAVILETLGTWGPGNDIYALQEGRIGWRTSAGAAAYMEVDSADTLYLVGTSVADGPRALLSCAMRSSTSSLILYPNTSIVGYLRQSIATGLTATGTSRTDAYAITASGSEFTTVAAGTGCILPANIAGGSIVIWNVGANTLNVYPVAGNQIDALGTNNPDTIASGASKRYTAITAGFYRTAP